MRHRGAADLGAGRVEAGAHRQRAAGGGAHAPAVGRGRRGTSTPRWPTTSTARFPGGGSRPGWTARSWLPTRSWRRSGRPSAPGCSARSAPSRRQAGTDLPLRPRLRRDAGQGPARGQVARWESVGPHDVAVERAHVLPDEGVRHVVEDPAGGDVETWCSRSSTRPGWRPSKPTRCPTDIAGPCICGRRPTASRTPRTCPSMSMWTTRARTHEAAQRRRTSRRPAWTTTDPWAGSTTGSRPTGAGWSASPSPGSTCGATRTARSTSSTPATTKVTTAGAAAGAAADDDPEIEMHPSSVVFEVDFRTPSPGAADPADPDSRGDGD